MSLRFKMNLALIITLLIGTGIIGVITYIDFKSQAKENALGTVLRSADIMMSSATATRTYISNQVNPLLARQGKRAYLPQSVPAHAVYQNIKQLKKQYPYLNYSEASINPTNTKHKATAWEQSVIRRFRDQPAKIQYGGVTPEGTHLYASKPIRVNSESCMGCHGDPDSMPLTLRERYKNSTAFGWKLNQLVGAQFVKIPLSVPNNLAAQQSFKPLLYQIIVIMALITIVLSVVLNSIVVKRVQRMSKTANAISLGSTKFGDFNVNGTDEIATLERSFNRMRRSLTNAIDLLEEKTGNYTRM